MSGSKLRKSITHLGIDLSKLDAESLEELSLVLEERLLGNLRRLLSSKVDIDMSIEVEIGETLDISVDLVVHSPTPLTPEVVVEIDKAIDDALKRFEEIVVMKCRRDARTAFSRRDHNNRHYDVQREP